MSSTDNREFVTTNKSRVEAGRSLVSSEKKSASESGLVSDAHNGARSMLNKTIDVVAGDDKTVNDYTKVTRKVIDDSKKGIQTSKNTIKKGHGLVTYGRDLHQIHRKQKALKKSFGSLNNLKSSKTLKKYKYAKTKKISKSASKTAVKYGVKKPAVGIKKVAGKGLDNIQNENEYVGAAIGIGRSVPGAAKKTYKSAKFVVSMPKRIYKATKALIKIGKNIISGISAFGKAIAAGGWIPLSIVGGVIVLVIFGSAIFGTITAILSDKGTGSLTGNEAIVAQALLKAGYNKLHVAGIMGNLSVESGCNPKAFQPREEREQLNGEERNDWRGFGIVQWTYERKSALCTNGDTIRKLHSNVDLQTDFLVFEAESGVQWICGNPEEYGVNPMTYSDWKRNDWDVSYLACGWAAYFERCGDLASLEKRKAEANRIYAALNNTGDGTILGEAQAIADDDSHGYSQARRTLNPDVDCSSFVFYACQHAGYNVGDYPFSTLNMESVLVGIGFTCFPYTGLSNLQPGDILLNSGHTEIFAGGDRSVGAHWDNGHPEPGDQGGEVDTGSACQDWSLVLRAPGK